ncbi:MAG: extradiol ring-cleavage dioxygenase [Chloroflexota bacterium]|nr:extradiol ring-cleavage dioxygenase [Chloroflexota bacterium]MDE2885092.1 extradiol ring-cleavage dioxygenase [Chloroflexota bacterium]
MAEIFGAGVTHYPPMLVADEEKKFVIHTTLKYDERVPEHMKSPINWPEPMRVEYGEDEGVASATAHRERLVSSFRAVKREIEAFDPDFILVVGDDQYENFRDDIIPPFCILAYEDSESTPFMRGYAAGSRNAWNEPVEKVFSYRGHAQAARWLTAQMIDQGVDMAYAYKPLHTPGLPHSILNTLLYLDYDREGFDVPVVPLMVNCYGSKVISNRGGALPQKRDGVFLEPDPPGPSPRRCMQVGAALARAIQESPWRVALVASSSWSHAFLTDKNYFLWPDLESDRMMFESLQAGDYDAWSRVSTPEIEAAGQQELLNWACLLGAMAELDRKPEVLDYVETYVFNSNKCMVLFRP